MKKIVKIMFCLMVVLMLINFAQAQASKTAKGYFCGMEEGDGGFISIRIGGTVRTFAIYNEEPPVKYVGIKAEQFWNRMKVGSELIIKYVIKKYRRVPVPQHLVRSMELTGKVNKKTQACGEDN